MNVLKENYIKQAEKIDELLAKVEAYLALGNTDISLKNIIEELFSEIKAMNLQIGNTGKTP
jgi:hypothetical protein